MCPDHRQPVLSGLVSRAAQDLYSKLQAHGALRIGTGPNEVDPSDAAVAELLDAGVAFRSGGGVELIRPVSPPTALQLLLKAQHARLSELQRALLDGWDRLNDLLPTTVGGASPIAGAGFDLIDNAADIARLAVEFYHATRYRLRGMETGEPQSWITENRTFIPPRPQRRARHQMIYQSTYADTRTGAAIIARSVGAGEQVRLRQTVRLKMLHVDDAVALLAVDRGAANALLIRAPAVIAALGEWFDLLWDDDATLLAGTAQPQQGPTDEQRQLLRLMYGGASDSAMANRLNTSVSTVRRKVRALCQELGVTGRFAAGAAAAKRGWL